MPNRDSVLIRTSPRIFCAVALVASSSLGFELLQTRVLSALYFNNLVYMTVTIALLGFGFSGVLASVMYRRLKNPERQAALCCAGLSVSIILCLCAASALPGMLPGATPELKMIISYFILIIPFVFAGAAISLLLMCHGNSVFGLYCADLGASALAAILFSLLLRPLGPARLAWAYSASAAAALVLQAPVVGIRLRHALPWTAALVAGFLLFGDRIVQNKPEFYKTTGRFYFIPEWTSSKLETSVWTPIAKIDVFSDSARDLETGEYLGHPPNFMLLTQDNDAQSAIHGEKDLAAFTLRAKQGRLTSVAALAYFMNPKPKDVLVIGVGGGVDIQDAHVFDAGKIDGVEINAATVDLMRTKFADYSQWPKWKEVTLYNAEGRRFAHLSQKKYDVIVLRGVDTFSALSSGAYVLSENYLYTVEAMKDYMNALKPNGVVVIMRWFFRQPRESLRLTNLFLSAAETTGEGRPDARLMVINDHVWAGTFIKRTPFTPEEVRIVSEKIPTEDYSWVYVPKVLGAEQHDFEATQFKRDAENLSLARSAYASLVSAPGEAGRAAFARAYPFKIDPVYDHRPFFFEYYKGNTREGREEYWGGQRGAGLRSLRGPVVHYVLYILLLVTTLFSAFAMGIPLAIFEREGVKIRRAWSLVGFFSALGVGFMFVEIGCMQWLSLYMGHPMYSLTVVLAALLFYAGLGSLAAGRWTQPILPRLRAGMLGTAVLIPAWLAAMKYVIPLTARWSLTGRISVVLVSLLPLGLCMGIPFATGLCYLADRHARFIPWAWGINGLTSVVASILAVVLAMRIGFTAVVLLSAVVYIAGYFSFSRHVSPA
jgi:MFS family permease